MLNEWKKNLKDLQQMAADSEEDSTASGLLAWACHELVMLKGSSLQGEVTHKERVKEIVEVEEERDAWKQEAEINDGWVKKYCEALRNGTTEFAENMRADELQRDFERINKEIARAYLERDEAQAENARLQELLDSTMAQLHATQEDRDEWAARREAIALRCDKQWMDLLASMKETERWKAVALAILPSKNHNDIYLKEAILDGNINDAERLLGIGESERKKP